MLFVCKCITFNIMKVSNHWLVSGHTISAWSYSNPYHMTFISDCTYWLALQHNILDSNHEDTMSLQPTTLYNWCRWLLLTGLHYIWHVWWAEINVVPTNSTCLYNLEFLIKTVSFFLHTYRHYTCTWAKNQDIYMYVRVFKHACTSNIYHHVSWGLHTYSTHYIVVHTSCTNYSYAHNIIKLYSNTMSSSSNLPPLSYWALIASMSHFAINISTRCIKAGVYGDTGPHKVRSLICRWNSRKGREMQTTFSRKLLLQQRALWY